MEQQPKVYESMNSAFTRVALRDKNLHFRGPSHGSIMQMQNESITITDGHHKGRQPSRADSMLDRKQLYYDTSASLDEKTMNQSKKNDQSYLNSISVDSIMGTHNREKLERKGDSINILTSDN